MKLHTPLLMVTTLLVKTLRPSVTVSFDTAPSVLKFFLNTSHHEKSGYTFSVVQSHSE